MKGGMKMVKNKSERWKRWIGTKFKGVRYYEHPTRRHGVGKDRYFAIRYQKDGKRIEEGIGWASELDPKEKQHWTAEKAAMILGELKESARGLKEGPHRLVERRYIQQVRQDDEQIKKLTVSDFYKNGYLLWMQDNKAHNTVRMEKLMFKRWVLPYIGTLPLSKVAQTHIEKIKKIMQEQGKSPKTIQHVLALIRQIYNYAKRVNIFSGDSPISRVNMPKVDNAKLRYLMPQEIKKLLTALKDKSEQVYEQAFLSINCGLRFAEVGGLCWEDVHYETGTVSIRDAKTGSRTVYMNKEVRNMLSKKQRGKKSIGLVFPDEHEQKSTRVSKTFQRVADELFNRGITDRRLRVTFHTLRHTFGTMVYNKSGDIYLTQKALGHKSILMATRYAKMAGTRLREAFYTQGKAIAFTK
jgi:integrase